MISLGTMVERVATLADTKDLTAWENEFVRSVIARTHNGKDTSRLSGKMIEVVESIHKKHFGDH